MAETALQTVQNQQNQLNTATARSTGSTQSGSTSGASSGFDPASVFSGLKGMSAQRKLLLMALVPILLGAIISAFMWSSSTSYRVLFSGVSDADGGAIVSTLKQMNIPYQYSEHDGAILVPAEKVHDTRLALASEGLPKGSTVGFDVFDRQKMGVTQFQEQVNFQRALEGELAKSIESLKAVESARVHLAMPKSTVFLRDSQEPTASIVVNLRGGRTLDKSQIAGIVHLISQSIPEMKAKNVSIVDQEGSLLTQDTTNSDSANMADQMVRTQKIESMYTKRLMEMLIPIYGSENVRATVTAKLDLAEVEQSAESYKPNSDPTQATFRSQQIVDESAGESVNPQGVPGVQSNTAPGDTTAPIGNIAPNAQAPAEAKQNARKEQILNYEVDRAVTVTKKNVMDVSQINAAVVLNNKTITNSKGETREVPLTPEEIESVRQMVVSAVGIKQDRGDTLSVTNQSFNKPAAEAPQQITDWAAMLQQSSMPLAVALVSIALIFGVIRPLFKKESNPMDNFSSSPVQISGPVIEEDLIQVVPNKKHEPIVVSAQDTRQIEEAKKMAAQNPELAANIVKSWIGD